MAKKKIKKLLKKALPAIALGLGAAALANRKKSGMSMPDNRDTRKTLLPKKDFMNIGGKAATKVDYFASPRERAGIVKNLGFKSISVEKIPNKGIGETINDRLLRAAKRK